MEGVNLEVVVDLLAQVRGGLGFGTTEIVLEEALAGQVDGLDDVARLPAAASVRQCSGCPFRKPVGAVPKRGCTGRRQFVYMPCFPASAAHDRSQTRDACRRARSSIG